MGKRTIIRVAETVRDKKTGRYGIVVAKGWWLVQFQLNSDLDDETERYQYRQECDLEVVSPEALYSYKEKS